MSESACQKWYGTIFAWFTIIKVAISISSRQEIDNLSKDSSSSSLQELGFIRKKWRTTKRDTSIFKAFINNPERHDQFESLATDTWRIRHVAIRILKIICAWKNSCILCKWLVRDKDMFVYWIWDIPYSRSRDIEVTANHVSTFFKIASKSWGHSRRIFGIATASLNKSIFFCQSDAVNFGAETYYIDWNGKKSKPSYLHTNYLGRREKFTFHRFYYSTATIPAGQIVVFLYHLWHMSKEKCFRGEEGIFCSKWDRNLYRIIKLELTNNSDSYCWRCGKWKLDIFDSFDENRFIFQLRNFPK